jgi:predicted MFS family arabinose efflux permease
MAQDLVPAQVSTVSALMMGFAWGMAGMGGIPLVGWIADRVGLERALWGVVILPLAGWILALRLPPSTDRRPA